MGSNSWLSGFFDAEGSINYHTKRNQPNLSISQKTREVLDMIKNFVGGNVYYDKSWEGYILYISKTSEIKKLLEYFKKNKLKNKHLDLYYLKKLMNMKTLKYQKPGSENHSKFLKTLEHLKNRK